MKNLPIGISTLSSIISEDMTYVDKTESAYRLASTMGRYFLSRPRRFGKSLFVDTLKEIFQGNKELFKGLYIYDKWNWEKKYPVIKIDFTGGMIKNTEDLNNKLNAVLSEQERMFNVTFSMKGISNQFHELIRNISEKSNSKIVILIDEYDKPLLDNIENNEIAEEIRDGLKNFYSVIKNQDAYLQFVFFTGVSKFSKVSIFSGINNLKDITLSSDYATICGYTQNDLKTIFAEHLKDVDWDKLKLWYNGYNFLGEKVYNPFDILLFISEHGLYRNYWFETGSPSFLIKLFQQNRYFLPDLDNIEVGEELLNTFEIDKIEPATLLFQSGYLTIKKVYTKMDRLHYILCFPNLEVKMAFSDILITSYTTMTVEKYRYEENTYDALFAADLPALEKTVTRLFAGIPYRNFTNNDLPDFEGYYASVLYAFFSAINCEIIREDISCRGQVDMTIKLGNNIFVMEIKVTVDSASEKENSALKQIQEKRYADKYIGKKDASVFEVGMIFSSVKRNLINFDWVKRL